MFLRYVIVIAGRSISFCLVIGQHDEHVVLKLYDIFAD